MTLPRDASWLGGQYRVFPSPSLLGLTTAASIWATAAVGIAVGLERFALAAGSTVLIFLILRVVMRLPFEGDQQAKRRRREPAKGTSVPDGHGLR